MSEFLKPVSLCDADDFMKSRCARLSQVFSKLFGDSPGFFVKAPGRVNLIGEHIDYCGYSVLPMALQQDVVLAVRRFDVHGDVGRATLTLVNINDKYPMLSCSLLNISELKPLKPFGDVGDGCGSESFWSNYVLAGIGGVLADLATGHDVFGMQILVDGQVMPSAGLSSSSALTCASAIAAAHCAQVAVDRYRMASQCARYETFVGTEGGGMDQAICLLAEAGCARRVYFDPVRVHSVRLPTEACFVVANSMVTATKAATCSFNCRVIECRLAVQILAKKCGLEWTTYMKFRVLQDALKKTTQEMMQLAKKYLTKEIYSLADVCAILETSTTCLFEVSFTANTRHLDEFKLQQRALHVLQEAERVDQFERECCVGRDDLMHKDIGSGELCSEPGVLVRLGRLMNDSHASCRHLYECSHPKLDLLCEIANELAYGARLTGAGWGGCVVVLIDRSRCQQLLQLLSTRYYCHEQRSTEHDCQLTANAFITRPSRGADIFV